MTEANALEENGSSRLAPTSLEELKKVNVCGEEVIELPPFVDGTPFRAKVRRPDILRMAEEGMIPNPLSAAVDELMDVNATVARTSITERATVLQIVAKASLVDPTYEDVERITGRPPDHAQLMALWSYVLNGVNALIPFRSIRELFSSGVFERAVQDGPELVPADNGTP